MVEYLKSSRESWSYVVNYVILLVVCNNWHALIKFMILFSFLALIFKSIDFFPLSIGHRYLQNTKKFFFFFFKYSKSKEKTLENAKSFWKEIASLKFHEFKSHSKDCLSLFFFSKLLGISQIFKDSIF
jgi:hypothetical protein